MITGLCKANRIDGVKTIGIAGSLYNLYGDKITILDPSDHIAEMPWMYMYF